MTASHPEVANGGPVRHSLRQIPPGSRERRVRTSQPAPDPTRKSRTATPYADVPAVSPGSRQRSPRTPKPQPHPTGMSRTAGRYVAGEHQIPPGCHEQPIFRAADPDPPLRRPVARCVVPLAARDAPARRDRHPARADPERRRECCGTGCRDAGWAHDADGAPRRITTYRRSRPAARPQRSLGLALRGGGWHRRDRGGRPGRVRDRSGWRPGAGRRFHDHQPAPGRNGQLGQGNARHSRQARAAGDHRARRAGAVRAGRSVGAASGVRWRAGVRGDRRGRVDRRADRWPVIGPGGRPDDSRSARRVSAAPVPGGQALSLVGGGHRAGSGDRGAGPAHLPDLDRRRRCRRDGRRRGGSHPGGHRGRRRGRPFAVPAADPDASRPDPRRHRAGRGRAVAVRDTERRLLPHRHRAAGADPGRRRLVA